MKVPDTSGSVGTRCIEDRLVVTAEEGRRLSVTVDNKRERFSGRSFHRHLVTHFLATRTMVFTNSSRTALPVLPILITRSADLYILPNLTIVRFNCLCKLSVGVRATNDWRLPTSAYPFIGSHCTKFSELVWRSLINTCSTFVHV